MIHVHHPHVSVVNVFTQLINMHVYEYIIIGRIYRSIFNFYKKRLQDIENRRFLAILLITRFEKGLIN